MDDSTPVSTPQYSVPDQIDPLCPIYALFGQIYNLKPMSLQRQSICGGSLKSPFRIRMANNSLDLCDSLCSEAVTHYVQHDSHQGTPIATLECESTRSR